VGLLGPDGRFQEGGGPRTAEAPGPGLPRLRLGRWIWLHTLAAALLPLAAFGWAALVLAGEGRAQLVWRLAAAVAVLATWVSYRLARRMAAQLSTLRDQVERIGAGDLAAPPAPAEPAALAAEIGELAAAMETMRGAVGARVGELELLNRARESVAAAAGLDELLAGTARYLAEAAEATSCSIALWDPAGERLAPAASHGDAVAELSVSGDLSLGRMVAGSQEPVSIRNVRTSTLLDPAVAAACTARSLLALPLLAQGRAIGVALIGDDRRERDFTPAQVERALAISSQAAAAVRNMRLAESTQRRLRDLSLLYQTSAAISSTLDEAVALEMAVQACLRVFEVDRAQLVIVEGGWARLAASEGDEAPWLAPGARFPVAGNGLLGWMAANRRPLAIRDARTAIMLRETRAALGWRKVASLLAVPLVAQGEMLGAILLCALGQERDFTAEELGLAQTMGNQIASVLQNARLYRRMEEEKRKFELAALNMGEGLIIIDSEDRVLFANPQARSLLAWDLDAAPVDPLAAQYPPAPLRELLNRRGERSDGILAGEVQINGARLTDLSVSLSPVRDEAGVLQWWVLVVHDITRLKELDRLKSEFISTVSHELRTPLASIIGFAELLISLEPGPLTDVQSEFVGIVYRSAEQLLALVNDLLDVSRLESGRFLLNPEPLDPADLVRRVQGSLQPLAEAKALRVRLEMPARLPLILVDPHRLEQVLTNLLSNAIKFTPEGGEVTVAVAEEGGKLRFAVTDTGIGIPAQDMERVFGRFYRSAESIRRAIGGTGLGLYIAKNIVESHGGEIGLESQEGQGTRVWFSLPVNGRAAGFEQGTEE